MNLLATRRRTLRGIERELAGSEPRLVALFATFTLLTRDEELPVAERLSSRPRHILARLGRTLGLGRSAVGWRARIWPALLCAAAVTACVIALVGVARSPASPCPLAQLRAVGHGMARCAAGLYWPPGK